MVSSPETHSSRHRRHASPAMRAIMIAVATSAPPLVLPQGDPWLGYPPQDINGRDSWYVKCLCRYASVQINTFQHWKYNSFEFPPPPIVICFIFSCMRGIAPRPVQSTSVGPTPTGLPKGKPGGTFALPGADFRLPDGESCPHGKRGSKVIRCVLCPIRTSGCQAAKTMMNQRWL